MNVSFPAEPRLTISLVAIFEHPEKWSWRRSAVGHYNLWFALKGHGEILHSGKAWPFASGSMFLFPPDLRLIGKAAPGKEMTNFTIHVEADRVASKFLDHYVSGGEPVQLGHLLWAPHLCRHLSEISFLREGEGSEVLMSGLQLLLRSMERARRLPEVDQAGRGVIQLVERIRRNPAAAYTVAEMADAVGLSAAHFNRRFKSVTGMSPVRFLIEERLGRAEAYLGETDLSIEEIAARLGYRDVYFFSRQFRQFRGIPPSSVRKGRLRTR